jgi:hypothetical protein
MTDTVTPTSLQASDLQVCAPGRTRPATYGLEVDPRSSMASRRVWSLLVKSIGSSSRYGPVTRCSAWRNDQRNDHADVVAADSPSPQAHAVEPGPCSGNPTRPEDLQMLVRVDGGGRLPCGWWHGLLLSGSRAAAAVLHAARASSIWLREGPGAGNAPRNRSRASAWRSWSFSSRSGGSSRSTRRATARSSRGSAGAIR